MGRLCTDQELQKHVRWFNVELVLSMLCSKHGGDGFMILFAVLFGTQAILSLILIILRTVEIFKPEEAK